MREIKNTKEGGKEKEREMNEMKAEQNRRLEEKTETETIQRQHYGNKFRVRKTDS